MADAPQAWTENRSDTAVMIFKFTIIQLYIGFLRAVGMGAVLEVFRLLYWRHP